jgi:formate hydrogenlyase subunit 3/multisubunit Na+/H+ antiporter MnhD subunit
MVLPVWAPLAVLAAGAFAVYLVARWVSRRNGLLAGLTIAIHALGLLCTAQLVRQMGNGGPALWAPDGAGHAMLASEPGGLLVALVAQSLGMLVSIYSGRYLALDHRYEDYYPLLLGLSGGVLGMVLASDLFVLYIFAGLTGVVSYTLVAFRRQTSTAVEAGYKYAIMGGMATTLMLAGVGYWLRAGGSLDMLAGARAAGSWGAVGVALVLGGVGLKAALVPAHTWLPDAHSRAPSSISAMLSGILVPAHVYVFIKTGLLLGWERSLLGGLLIAAALLGMSLGNLMALVQTYGKRMLAYSTIAQVGYILLAFGIGLLYGRAEALAGAFFLLAAHAALKALAFLAKGVCHFYCDATRLEELDGLYYRLPFTGACFSIALLGLAGFPPLAVFAGKWLALVGMSVSEPLVTGLVLLFLANSLLSVAYYAPPIYRLFKTGHERAHVAVSRWMLAPLALLLGIALALGVYPGPLMRLAERAAAAMLGWGG